MIKMIGYIIFDNYDFSRYHWNVQLHSRGLPFLREAMNVNTFSALIWNLTCNLIVNEGLGDVQCASECSHFFVLLKNCWCKILLCTRTFLCICMYVCWCILSHIWCVCVRMCAPWPLHRNGCLFTCLLHCNGCYLQSYCLVTPQYVIVQ
jgi:hypothetical protein